MMTGLRPHRSGGLGLNPIHEGVPTLATVLDQTARVWKILSSKPELKGFVLIGGSALARHIDHRISEDLDFAWP